jgi:hypothetical protein
MVLPRTSIRARQLGLLLLLVVKQTDFVFVDKGVEPGVMVRAAYHHAICLKC